MHNLTANTQMSGRPVFRAEISPPPMDKATPVNSRSITPPIKKAQQSILEHVEPLPPVGLRRAHDRPNETAAGYTFLSDTLNTAFNHADPDCRTPALSTRIARTESLRTGHAGT